MTTIAAAPKHPWEILPSLVEAKILTLDQANAMVMSHLDVGALVALALWAHAARPREVVGGYEEWIGDAGAWR